MKITDTEPGFKGDTATGATKPATVETGAVVYVPLFVETGDKLKIDTRTGRVPLPCLIRLRKNTVSSGTVQIYKIERRAVARQIDCYLRRDSLFVSQKRRKQF